ncbi:HAMP domain-containing histidine kinase [Acrocarpospora phusangensis]|nr:HAMP domain-containing histidine kinase [Acrocarpospora phusangensis]
MTIESARTQVAVLDAMSAELELINITGAGRMTEAPGAAPSRLARAINSALDRADEAEERSGAVLDEQRRLRADAMHCLRTPVAAVRAELEEARLHPGDTDLEGLLSRTLCAVDRLQGVIEELRLLAEPRPPEQPSAGLMAG